MRAGVQISSLITAICLITGASTSYAASSPSRGISVNLRAKWPAPPTVLEAYEFLVRAMTPHGSGLMWFWILSRSYRGRLKHITNMLITCVTQAQEAPDKQAEFLAAWESGEGKDSSQCWDDVIRTASSFLSRSQQKVSMMSRKCCAINAGYHHAHMSM